jgi:hypothetical protein
MFEEIFFPRTAQKHRAAPLAEPRARYLRRLKEIGARRSTLRKCANAHLNLVRRSRDGASASLSGTGRDRLKAAAMRHKDVIRCGLYG